MTDLRAVEARNSLLIIGFLKNTRPRSNFPLILVSMQYPRGNSLVIVASNPFSPKLVSKSHEFSCSATELQQK